MLSVDKNEKYICLALVARETSIKEKELGSNLPALFFFYSSGSNK